jgi:hypothetical protein
MIRDWPEMQGRDKIARAIEKVLMEKSTQGH